MDCNHWIRPVQQITPAAILGRCAWTDQGLRPFWALSGMEIMLQCTFLSIEIEAQTDHHAPWIALWADGSLIARFPVQNGRHWYPLLLGMDASIPHRLSILRDTQPIEDSGMGLSFCALRSDGQLLPLSSPALRFEFIGDSLTTGEGCIGPVSANEWKTAWMCPSLGYAHFLCQRMDARASLISQSGWGVYCDWANTRKNHLPRIYDQLCGVVPEGQLPYDFPEEMDAVIINLGTNDVSALKSLPEAQRAERAEILAGAASAFLLHLRSLHPRAFLLWVYGMCGQEYIECFRQGVEKARAQGGGPIGFCALPPCEGEEIGSHMHPGPLSHLRCARVIEDYLKNVLPGKE